MNDKYPLSTMGQIISQCEQALEQEDWSELNITKTLDDFQSVTLCNALGHLFENTHQVVKNRRSLSSLEVPKYLSLIRLHNPEFRLKFADEYNNPLNLSPIGEVPVGYMDVILDTTFGNEGQEYTGPHLVGLVDTGIFKNQEYIREGQYTFLTPLRMVEVSFLHIPHEFN